ncbi:MAG: pyridoxine 5'-phosphate synthase [Bacteroidota bacterium]
MTRLSVNINKIATLRNARGGGVPDVVTSAIRCERFGAQGITVHPRPDGRHIRYADVIALKPIVTTEFNVEGYPSRDFIDLVLDVLPHQVTLVPDPPEAITSNQGWDTSKHKDFLKEVISEFKKSKIRTSVFISTDSEMIAQAAETGTDRVELYTEPYAKTYSIDKEAAVLPFAQAAQVAHDFGLGVNAGHDLSLENLQWFAQQVPHLEEVSIGHALICDALWYGMENAIQMYLRKLNP